MRKLIVLIFVMLMLSGCDNIEKEDNSNYDRILYSWHLSTISSDKEKFESVIKDYDINVIYQSLDSDFFENVDDSFIKKMNSRDIKVYYLGGNPSWGKVSGFSKIKRKVDSVIEFNNMATNKISGIVLDIEPYVSEKEEVLQVEDFKIYVEEIKKAYQYIKDNDLEMILSIPYWFDTIDADLLEEVVKNCDGISVMNYKITRTSENIKEEIELAKKYNKKIDTIYEVDYEDEGYFKNHSSILRDYKRIRKNNDCENLGVAYHHFDSM